MSKKCASCTKAVYPLEEFKCLDKIWHKQCFRCNECKMQLNMKNYKGYDKLPYCNAHYPKGKHTAVADTPENLRVATNTKNQSNLSYHEAFEKEKGKYTAIAEDSEIQRLLATSRKTSLLTYHEDFEKSKGKYTAIADDPEIQRLLETTKKTSLIAYHENFEKDRGKYTQIADDPETLRLLANQDKISLVKYHEDFEKNIKGTKIEVPDDKETSRIKQTGSIISQVEYKGLREKAADMESRRKLVPPGADPMMYQQENLPPDHAYVQEPEFKDSPYSSRNQGHTIFNTQGRVEETPATQKVGSIADYDPSRGRHGSLGQGYMPTSYGRQTEEWEETISTPSMPQHQEEQRHPAHYPPASTQSHYNPPPPQPQAPPEPEPYYPPQQTQQQRYEPEPVNLQNGTGGANNPMAGMHFKAMYDYQAGDSDEVGFNEGDIIEDPAPIDEGWMFGTVRRTGQRGMLPANYVEPV